MILLKKRFDIFQNQIGSLVIEESNEKYWQKFQLTSRHDVTSQSQLHTRGWK